MDKEAIVNVVSLPQDITLNLVTAQQIISDALDSSDKKYVEIPINNGHAVGEGSTYNDLPKGYVYTKNNRNYENNGYAPIPDVVQDAQHITGNPTGIIIDSSGVLT